MPISEVSHLSHSILIALIYESELNTQQKCAHFSSFSSFDILSPTENLEEEMTDRRLRNISGKQVQFLSLSLLSLK